MPIDWFTVVAQVLNFLVLAWLLKRVLYRRVLDAVDAREQRIALQLEQARQTDAKAQAERAELQRRSAEFDAQKAALLAQATADARAERQRLLEQARVEVNAVRAQHEQALQSEAARMADELARRMQHRVFAIARQALAELSGSQLESRMAEVFVERLNDSRDPALAAIREQLRRENAEASVRSAFALAEPDRRAIAQAVEAFVGAVVPVRFEAQADVLAGIELVAAGHKVVWGIADYVAELEQSAAELLDKGAGAATASRPAHASRA